METPSKNLDFKQIKKERIEEYLFQLETNEPTLVNREMYNYLSEYNALVEPITILASDMKWIIDTENEVDMKIRNHSEALESGNIDLDHLDSIFCKYIVGSLHTRLAALHEILYKVNKNYGSLLNLQKKVEAKTSTQQFRKIIDEYYTSLVKGHLALMETEVCFPRYNKFDEYLMAMYGVEKHCFFKAVKPRKSNLLLGQEGKDSVLMIKEIPVTLVAPDGVLKYLAPVDEH